MSYLKEASQWDKHGLTKEVYIEGIASTKIAIAKA